MLSDPFVSYDDFVSDFMESDDFVASCAFVSVGLADGEVAF